MNNPERKPCDFTAFFCPTRKRHHAPRGCHANTTFLVIAVLILLTVFITGGIFIIGERCDRRFDIEYEIAELKAEKAVPHAVLGQAHMTLSMRGFCFSEQHLMIWREGNEKNKTVPNALLRGVPNAGVRRAGHPFSSRG